MKVIKVKQNYELLEKTKSLFSDLFSNYQVGVWSVCLKTNKVLNFSKSLEQIYEIQRNDFNKNPSLWKSLIHKEDMKEVEASQQQLFKGIPIKNKYRITTPSGKVKWLYDHTIPHIDDNGELIRLDGMILNITDYVHNLEGIRKELKDIKRAIDKTSNVLISDHLGNITYVNDYVCQSSQYNKEELLGQTPSIFTSGVHPKSFYQNIWNKITSGQIWRGEICNRRKDGSLFWLSGTIVPFLDESGKPYQYISIRNDITEQKLLQEELLLKRKQIKNGEKKLESLLKFSSEAVAVTNLQGEFEYCSASFDRILHFQQDKLLRTSVFSLVHHEDKHRLENFMMSSVEKMGKPFTFELRLMNAFHQWIECEIVLNNYLHEPGINGLIMNIRDISKAKEAQRLIEYSAYHDFLTGLKNRRFFEEEVEKRLSDAKNNESKLALIILDLDRFKFVNDTLGHFAGDELLKELGKRLSQLQSEQMVISRIGGDEFGIIVSDTGMMESLDSLLQQIMNLVAKSFIIDELEIYITSSIGVSIFPNCGHDTKTLLKNADIAMYRVKEEGKNNFLIFDPNMDVDSYKKFTITSDLRKAIELNELEVHYQPKVDIKTNQIVGAEALVRWKHPVWGYVPPNEFISIAEETRLINNIGDWVLEEVTRHLKEREYQRLPQIPIAINLSPIQFLQQNIVEKMKRTLDEFEVDPELIEIEVTETSLIDNEKQVIRILEEFCQIGIKIAIDDFGTGYSSLMYLNKFKIDILKIDQYFLKDITIEKNSQQIFNAIVKLAQGLGMLIVVEGVETTKQLEFINEYKDIIVQGFLFSKPLEVESFNSLIKTGYCVPQHNLDKELTIEKRNYFRINFIKPIEAEMTLLQIGTKPINIGYTKILIENIGPGGLCYLSHINLPIRKDLLLKFKFMILGNLFEIKGNMVWSNIAEDQIYHYGIQFIVSEKEKEDLTYILNQLQIKLKKNPIPPESNVISVNKFSYMKQLIKGN